MPPQWTRAYQKILLRRHGRATQRARGVEVVLYIGNHSERRAPGRFKNLSLGASPKPGNTTRLPVQLPVEVWEQIIDLIALGSGSAVILRTCALVCRAWSTRCRLHLIRNLFIREKGQANGLSRRIRKDPYLKAVVRTVTVHGEIDVLGRFASAMARKLPRVETLELSNVLWLSHRMHVDVVTHIQATFSSVTQLTLSEVTFPSVTAFGRVVCALPRLSALACRHLRFEDSAFIRSRVVPPKGFTLSNLDLENSDKTLAFLSHSSIPVTPRYIEWTPSLSPYDSTLPGSLQPLLDRAGASLSSLNLHLSELLPELRMTENINVEVISLFFWDRMWEKWWNWQHTLLSSASPSKLNEVSVTFVLGSEISWSYKGLLASVDEESCTQIDHLLARSQYARLRVVSFVLRIELWLRWDSTQLDDVPLREDWQRVVSLRFSRLHERGVLRSEVTIEVNA